MSGPVEAAAEVPRIEPLLALDLAQTRAAALIAELGDSDWSLPTPCDDWCVRDIVNKMVASTIVFTAFGQRSFVRIGHRRLGASGALLGGWHLMSPEVADFRLEHTDHRGTDEIVRIEPSSIERASPPVRRSSSTDGQGDSGGPPCR